jgi:hypothetical protein
LRLGGKRGFFTVRQFRGKAQSSQRDQKMSFSAYDNLQSLRPRANRSLPLWLFLRTLRQLRDLRRYSTPITINNPQQVNIAVDGGKQVNVADAELQTDTH